MSKKYPQVTAKDIVKVLERLGFSERAQKGSHRQFEKNGHSSTVTVPNHKGKTIKPGTFKSILNQMGVSRKDFFDELK